MPSAVLIPGRKSRRRRGAVDVVERNAIKQSFFFLWGCHMAVRRLGLLAPTGWIFSRTVQMEWSNTDASCK